MQPNGKAIPVESLLLPNYFAELDYVRLAREYVKTCLNSLSRNVPPPHYETANAIP